MRYTNFNSTALCSPTRAALITGRNHRMIGFGVISRRPPAYPSSTASSAGQRHRRPHPARPWLRHLLVRQGPQHARVPGEPSGAVRPVADRHGLRLLLGFVGGDANQWPAQPVPQHDADLSLRGQAGLELTTAMADDAIQHMKMLNETQPDKPFFVYYVPGGTHAPHHPTPEWIKRIGDLHLFDQGWNKLRETIFANQRRLGVIRRKRS
ncbi:MAG: sulfatase-like hydrolase/transferase [Geminicoccaceae bacterium]